jgi:CHAT domain-containing protein/tetratricopeptide (TPR) repeat protein
VSASADALAQALVEATAARRAALRAAAPVGPQELGWALKRLVDAAWSSDPPATVRIAACLEELARDSGDPQVQALAAWSRGIANLGQGRMEDALADIDRAASMFTAQHRRHEMASARVSQLMALAMLGRYDEAAACGAAARDVFIEVGDRRSAGKIELNLGNIAYRRDHCDVASAHYRAAIDSFRESGDAEHGIMAAKGLADTLARQHDFETAAALYETALADAYRGGFALLSALAEGDIGALDMQRGRYDRALHFLERSRRGLAALQVPHYLAVAEESLADAYLELCLLPEALALYQRSLATYESAGMLADQAWALAQQGRTLALLGDSPAAAASLARAQQLFTDEDNPVGLALAHLWSSELALADGDVQAAIAHANDAAVPLAGARHWSGHLAARAQQARALRGAARPGEAVEVATQARAEAHRLGMPHIARRCDVLLGELALDGRRPQDAEAHFRAAVAQIESARGVLPGEEFRSAFLGENLLPYRQLARITLAAGDAGAAARALGWVEQARARALSDALADGAAEPRADAGGPDASAERTRLRQHLNACYHRLAHPRADGVPPAALHDEVHRLERALLEANRRDLQLGAWRGDSGEGPGPAHAVLDIASLQDALGASTVLVEYATLGDELVVFVVDQSGVTCVPLATPAARVRQAVEQLRFQIDTLRHGVERLRHRLPEMRSRASSHLRDLHAAVWAPIAGRIGARRVVVVPDGSLHAAPFEALFDGVLHEVERREIVRLPSARTMLAYRAREAPRFERALLLGYTDERLPHVPREIGAVAACFDGADVRLGRAASTAALRAAAPTADVIHVACHAQFRADSPRFSALHLADGALTAREAAHLRLRCSLLTLSACETGVAAVGAGNEPIGLTASCLAAGAPSVLASLWTVQDDVTADLMATFYARLRAGDSPARALRSAQCATLATHPHPYFWAAFVLHGRS